VNFFGLFAIAWTVIYLGVRFINVTMAGRRPVREAEAAAQTAEEPSSAVEPLAQSRTISVPMVITAVGLAGMAVWLMRRALLNRR
jgi:hypothetical protein